MTSLILIFFTGTALLFSCNVMNLQPVPGLPAFPGHATATFDQQHCAESSGIVYSASRNTLFVVDDEGDICELRMDGTLLKKGRIHKTDLEGITLNPATGMLYALDERADAILEIHPEKLAVLRRLPLDITPAIRLPGNKDNRGFEAITFVADPDDASDGIFFLASQGWSAKQPAAVFNTTAPLSTFVADKPVQISRSFKPGISDLSGLHFDIASGWLLLISDEHNTLLLITTGGAVQASYALPGENQEGITLDAAGHLYITEDTGNIIKYSFPAMP